jgi:hypothetical protein
MEKRLPTVHVINEAVSANVNGRNNGVFARMSDGTVHRINRARTVHGQLQVHSLVDGRWLVPVMVFQR